LGTAGRLTRAGRRARANRALPRHTAWSCIRCKGARQHRISLLIDALGLLLVRLLSWNLRNCGAAPYNSQCSNHTLRF
jgi:hypothetical protein